MNLEQIITKHLLDYNQAELDSLVLAERTTYEELATSIKKDMEKAFQVELQALAKGVPIKEYIALIMSIEGLILAKISHA